MHLEDSSIKNIFSGGVFSRYTGAVLGGDYWYVRYWERRNIGGDLERKRVTHQLDPITTRSKRPPSDIVNETERHMATVNSGSIPAGYKIAGYKSHEFQQDDSLPKWHGWHAARRNLYRLGVPEMVIQRILSHANVSTTATDYIKTVADDVRSAMTKLENEIAESQLQTDSNGTLET
jgi:hypothetical protein